MIASKLSHRLLRLSPYVRELERSRASIGEFPAGSLASALVTDGEVDAYYRSRAQLPSDLRGIDFNHEGQRAFLKASLPFYAEQPFTDSATEGLRYHFDQPWFCQGDGLMLYNFLRVEKPRRVIEVGSGYSSALMLDVVDRFDLGETELTFIEPFPDRLNSLLREGDRSRAKVIQSILQEVPLTLFDSLESGDLLFVDSSHVAKVGSDVTWIFFDVMERLKPGVFVHFHDILYPFEYPKSWFTPGNVPNELYFLRAFLTGNQGWKMHFFNSYAAQEMTAEIEQNMPLFLKNPGGSIYLRRC